YDPLSGVPGFKVEEGTPTSRALRALMYRVAFVPVLMAGAACAIVWASTHPRPSTAELDPASQGIYYEPVTFVGSDQIRLEGWLIPVIDAKKVLEDKDRVLWKQHPALVLVHDMGMRRDQLLPMIKPLHEAGYVVLAINLRGCGAQAGSGETFGLRESSDVRAAVDMLRRRPFVDPDRVGLIGAGTGANAALLAAQADSQIAVVIADHPICDSTELVQSHLLPPSPYLKWMGPLCKWTFEMSYGVRISDLEMTRFRQLFDAKPVLLVGTTGLYADPCDPTTTQQMVSFLASALPEENPLANAK
ncbi:MAG TPA: alpha/beta fold hydrolase, partial [Tepidisphaeraceae bacterium]|nr:alpha/beta fold hydrolase [Tepidisphaeraceae bacterium]